MLIFGLGAPMSASDGIRGCLLAFLVSLSACFQEKADNGNLAGTSVGTGNPGKLTVSFTEDGAPSSFSGTVEVYASTQIPIPPYHPEPLAKFVVLDSSSLEIAFADIDSISDSLWPVRSRKGDSIFLFNLVVKGDSTGAVIQGLVLNRNMKALQRIESISMHGSNLEVLVPLAHMDTLVTYVPLKTLDSVSHSYMFLYGSGYFAKSDSGRFQFPPMPRQSYELSIIVLPDSARHIMGGQDSTTTGRFLPPVYPGTIDTLAYKGEIETVRLPKEYIFK